MKSFLKLLFILALCQQQISYCQQVTSISAWRINLIFNISCDKYANFNVYSTLLFNKSGPVAKSLYTNNGNRHFRQFAKLDRIPNLEFDEIDLKIEIELGNDQIHPENVLSLNVSYLHMGEMTLKMEKKWPDEELKFTKAGRSRIISIVDIDFGRQFKRLKYNDCYHDQKIKPPILCYNSCINISNIL
uniref:Uncharacterized protein n=1 Tax=Romanomermis culicivorax TaxID=13658 RepID=A0A915JW84_ROMCU